MNYTAFFGKYGDKITWQDYPTFTAAITACRKFNGDSAISVDPCDEYANCENNTNCGGGNDIYYNRDGVEEFYAYKNASDYDEIKAHAAATERATFEEI